MREITFDASTGPMIDGSWVNTKTGDMFTVRETFFQDNQFIIQTMDGRMLDCNFISDYIRMENEKVAKEMSNHIKQTLSSTKDSIGTIPQEVKNMIDDTINPSSDSQVDYTEYMIPEDMDVGVSPKNIFTNTSKEIKSIQSAQLPQPQINHIESEDLLFIKRALKTAKGPELDVKIKWDNYPESKINLLQDMMGVDIDNIIDWFVKDVDFNKIKDDIKKSIRDYIISPHKPTSTIPEVNINSQEETRTRKYVKKSSKKVGAISVDK